MKSRSNGMTGVDIRMFRYSDLAAVIALAQEAFADDFRAQGMTPACFDQQARLITRVRLLPVRLLSRLIGVKWAFFVAEKTGQVVGFAICFSRKKAAVFGNLMVAPACGHLRLRPHRLLFEQPAGPEESDHLVTAVPE